MQLGTTPNRPKPGTHDAAAPARIATTQDDAQLCVCMAWTAPGPTTTARTGPVDAGGTTSRPDDGADDRPHAGRRGWTQTPGRTIAGTHSPRPVRIAENTSIHLSL